MAEVAALIKHRIYALIGQGAAKVERQYPLIQLAWLARQGAAIGRGVVAFGAFHFHGNPRNLRIGDGTTINAGVVLNASGELTIGRNVRLSNHVQLQTDELEPASVEAHREHRTAAVVVSDGVWLASGAIVVPGVTIGARTIVAAGAVVTRSFGANLMVAGVPAKVIRHLKVEPDWNSGD